MQGLQNQTAPVQPAEPAAPSCDLSNVQQPASALQQPTSDMSLVLVALGQGTQNYTCADETATPAAFGAMAELFDASCAPSSELIAGATSLDSLDDPTLLGTHFFLDRTTPDFDLSSLGNTVLKKVEDAPAPDAAADVKWLRLQTQAQGTTSDVVQIYRLNTVGGHPPATCEGQAPGEVITVDYEAQYWFYA
ncbi:hypothetical protein BDW02DRAFT_498100 [Decorospora gaudefroyi]|uniref:Malate dehydrogenase n=1 Tax=Decorospora gaudefroyi TaxID=184978 RepID=A0A6A5KGH9_9PLEO|nr:hypothetical protein BDW02DRAFT_498100 [Decorospora gaudefroyi]